MVEVAVTPWDQQISLAGRFAVPTDIGGCVIWLPPELSAFTASAPAELLTDGDCEDAGVAGWPDAYRTILSKETTDPYAGTRNLRLTVDGGSPFTGDSVLTVGREYTVSGWYRSDGIIPIGVGTFDNGSLFVHGPSRPDGGLSTSWAYFEGTGIADHTQMLLGSPTGAVGSWIEFDDVSVKLSGSQYIDQWADYSGNSTHFTQATAAKRMQLITSGSVPFARGEALGETYLGASTCAALFGGSPFHFLSVNSTNDATAGRITPGIPRIYLTRSNVGYVDNHVLTIWGSSSASKVLRHWAHDGTDLYYRENGVEIDRAAKALDALDAAQFIIGGAGGGYADGDFYEVVAYRGALSASEIADIEGYLIGKHGL